MAPPPAPESPIRLLPAPADAPSRPAAPSTSAAAYALQPHRKPRALPARQESARTRRAPLRCPTSPLRYPEILRARIRERLQISPPASNASARDRLATASCRDPQAAKLTRA